MYGRCSDLSSFLQDLSLFHLLVIEVMHSKKTKEINGLNGSLGNQIIIVLDNRVPFVQVDCFPAAKKSPWENASYISITNRYAVLKHL